MKSDLSEDYKKEYMETLNILYKKNYQVKSFKYFLDSSYLWFEKERRRQCRPKIVVLGPEIPEEILLATGDLPYWILGGSHCAEIWSDAVLPRDTDPVNRSVMGFLYEKDGVDYSDALFLVPVNCDSMRKMAYMLVQDGRKVVTLDIPPDKEDPYALEKWKRQIRIMTEAVENHLDRKLSAKRILRASKEVADARWYLRKFLAVTEKQEQILSGSARLLVQNQCHLVKHIVPNSN